jgi:phosphatidylglycerophosphate synthase/choline kinase
VGSAVAGRVPSAVLFATVPAMDGGPAASLPAGGRTLLQRLLAQLEDVGVRRTWVVTRPEWAAELQHAAGAGTEVTIRPSAGLDEDLQAVADIAGEVDGPLLLGAADVLMHQRPLAVLLADPRIRSGVLVTTARGRAGQAFRVRSAKGRIVGADSAYHRLHRPTGYQLGFAVLDPADLPELAGAARRMGAIAGDPLPAGWPEELERKVEVWRVSAAAREAAEAQEAAAQAAAGDRSAAEQRAAAEEHAEARQRASAAGLATDAGGPLVDTDTVGGAEAGPDGAPLVLSPEGEERVAHRAHIAAHDPLPLLVVALVRSGVRLTPGYLRAFFYARPVSREGAAHAVELIGERDEDKLALASAVKASDGFFTTFFVSPYSRYIARFAARRGWTPNAMTTVSMLIGILSAVAFGTGSRAGQITGAILLQAAFTVDCVDGQLARYTLRFSKLGAWLDSIFDRSKEYVVYAGLAVGASRGFHQDVWVLAAAALTLQTFRHMLGFAFDGSRHEKLQALPHLPLEQSDDHPSRPAAAPGVAPGGAPGAGAASPAAVAVVPAAATAAGRAAVAEPEPAPKPPLAMRPIVAVGKLDRFKPLRWARRIWLLPIGERFALISITAALFTPRVTFISLLVWGGATAIWGVTGRVLRSVGS